MEAADLVNNPPHYRVALGNLQPIEVIHSWGLGFDLGNAIKYLGRAPHKGTELQDLRKAEWYIKDHMDWWRTASLLRRFAYLCFSRSYSTGLMPSHVAHAWRLPDELSGVLCSIHLNRDDPSGLGYALGLLQRYTAIVEARV